MDFDFWDNPIGAIIGILVLIILASVLISFLSVINNAITEDRCKPFQDKIAQCQTEITGLKGQVSETNFQLMGCREDYRNLIEQNITKQDIEEMKGYFNVTQIEINNLNQRFDQIVENYYKVESVIITKYSISLAFNIVFALEILSFMIFKSELAVAAINFIRNRRRKQE